MFEGRAKLDGLLRVQPGHGVIYTTESVFIDEPQAAVGLRDEDDEDDPQASQVLNLAPRQDHYVDVPRLLCQFRVQKVCVASGGRVTATQNGLTTALGGHVGGCVHWSALHPQIVEERRSGVSVRHERQNIGTYADRDAGG